MQKSSLLSSLKEAQKSHKDWVESVRKLRRKEIRTFSIPLSDSECDFGKWFYKEAKRLKKLYPGEVEFIIKLHLQLHETFEQMHSICFGRGMDKFLTFFKLFKTLNEEEKRRLLVTYKKLLHISAQLQKKLTLLEYKIKTTDEELFKTIGS